ncbi:MAG: phosphatase PAP2 family protein [Bacteroidaceae bacterium]|nr:phosphatase PAP2 family protein [Bacteroidaceae bacterium]
MNKIILRANLFFFLLICNAFSCLAQKAIDTAYYSGLEELLRQKELNQNLDMMKIRYKIDCLDEEKSFQYDWTRPMIKGLILTFSQKDFRDRPGLFPERDFGKEDYAVALTPLAANWLLKASGVKSRSSFKRMALANSMALAFHVGLVKGLKTVAEETRPNGVDDCSLPSGHTSLAYMSASILSREYGYISPWVTVGSYGCASATQFLRMRHNNHWIHDTFLGAGIGILSANFAYYLTDRILGSDEIYTPDLTSRDLIRLARQNSCPSGFRFLMGTESGAKTINVDDLTLLTDYDGDVTVKTGASYTVGADASLFFNEFFSLEAMVRMSSAHAKVDASPVGGGGMPMFMGRSMSIYHFDLAGNFSIPYNVKKRLGGKVLAGVRNTQELTFDSYSYDASDNLQTSAFLKVPGQTRFEIGAGFTYDVLEKKNYAVGFVFDYYHTFSSMMADRYSALASWKVFL